jgi:membrane protease YdiL (CAAX protease family)
MTRLFAAIGNIIWTGALAIIMTALVSGIWTAFLVANLKSTPALPWSVAAMALALWALWSFLGGSWGPARSRAARRAHLRAAAVSPATFVAAVTAGTLCIVALAGLWIVLHQLVKVPGNPLPDFSRYPVATVAATLAMAAISGAVSEEAGFRGYFQGTLERYLPSTLAVLVAALVMAPEHALTQGFVWPTLLFYVLVDAMLGATAVITRSILPGVVIHAIGLAVFFALVWPHDAVRQLVSLAAPDPWFAIHVAQTLVFGALGIALFRRLARNPQPLARGLSAPRAGSIR